MQKRNPRIGIIGGMGPRATVQFERLLISRLGGNDQQLPDIACLNFGHIPDRTAFLVGNGQNPADAINVVIRQLESLEVDVLCMPCNTAHAPKIFDQLKTTLGTPILHMPNAAMALASRSGFRRCLILGTAGTRQSGIFKNERTLQLKPSEQKLVSLIIDHIKQNEDTENEMTQLKILVSNYNPDCVMLACTELGLIANSLTTLRIPVIDTLAVLADTCVQYIQKEIYRCPQPKN